MVRDLTYRDGERSAPAREFCVQHNGGLLSVTVAHFADGPVEDVSLIDSAAETMFARGEFKFEQSVSLIDENGGDLDTNPVLDTPTIGASGGLPSRQYDCES